MEFNNQIVLLILTVTITSTVFGKFSNILKFFNSRLDYKRKKIEVSNLQKEIELRNQKLEAEVEEQQLEKEKLKLEINETELDIKLKEKQLEEIKIRINIYSSELIKSTRAAVISLLFVVSGTYAMYVINPFYFADDNESNNSSNVTAIEILQVKYKELQNSKVFLDLLANIENLEDQRVNILAHVSGITVDNNDKLYLKVNHLMDDLNSLSPPDSINSLSDIYEYHSYVEHFKEIHEEYDELIHALALNETEEENYEKVLRESLEMVKNTSENISLAKQVNTVKNLVGLSVGDKLVLDNLNFESSLAILKPEATSTLNYLLAFLNDNPKLKIELIGHTAKGKMSEYHYIELSKRRAEYVKKWLVLKGIDANRISTIGKGSNEPMIQVNDLMNKNMRVEIKIIENS